MRSPSAVLAALYKARGVEHPDLEGADEEVADQREYQRVLRVLTEATPAALACLALDIAQDCDEGAKPNERLAAAKFALDCHREVVESIARK